MQFLKNFFSKKSITIPKSPYDGVYWIDIKFYFANYNSSQNWPWVLISNDDPLPEVAIWKPKGYIFLASPEGWYGRNNQPASIQNPNKFLGLPLQDHPIATENVVKS